MRWPRWKRTYDSTPFDFPCQNLLTINETLAGVITLSCDQQALMPNAPLLFGTPVIGNFENTYNDGSSSPPNQWFRVQISGGEIPATFDDLDLGVPNILLTLRANFTVSPSPTQLQAVVQFVLIDNPIAGM